MSIFYVAETGQEILRFVVSGFEPSNNFFGARDHVLKIVVNEFDDRCTFDELIGLV